MTAGQKGDRGEGVAPSSDSRHVLIDVVRPSRLRAALRLCKRLEHVVVLLVAQHAADGDLGVVADAVQPPLGHSSAARTTHPRPEPRTDVVVDAAHRDTLAPQTLVCRDDATPVPTRRCDRRHNTMPMKITSTGATLGDDTSSDDTRQPETTPACGANRPAVRVSEHNNAPACVCVSVWVYAFPPRQRQQHTPETASRSDTCRPRHMRRIHRFRSIITATAALPSIGCATMMCTSLGPLPLPPPPAPPLASILTPPVRSRHKCSRSFHRASSASRFALDRVDAASRASKSGTSRRRHDRGLTTRPSDSHFTSGESWICCSASRHACTDAWLGSGLCAGDGGGGDDDSADGRGGGTTTATAAADTEGGSNDGAGVAADETPGADADDDDKAAPAAYCAAPLIDAAGRVGSTSVGATTPSPTPSPTPSTSGVSHCGGHGVALLIIGVLAALSTLMLSGGNDDIDDVINCPRTVDLVISGDAMR